MNQNRREFLKLMTVAPRLKLVPTASANAKPVLIAVRKVPQQPITQIEYSETVRHFVLVVPGEVARLAYKHFVTLTGSTNAHRYRGFEPGTLRCVGWQISGKGSGEAARIDFELRATHALAEESAEPIEMLKRLYLQNRTSFAAIPDGKWYELPPSFERKIVYMNSRGEQLTSPRL